MATPRTKEEALQQMRLMWFGFIVTIPLYIYMGETMTGFSWLNFSYAGKTFAVLSILDLYCFMWAWRKRYSPALGAIQREPENIHAVRRWMSSWTILICMAESETLFGFAFRKGDKTLQQSLPFYIVGLLLTLWLWPRHAWSSTKIGTQ